MIYPMDPGRKNLYSVCFSQFGNAFSANFVNVFLPFYILKISPYSREHTLLWIGAIIGSPSICAAVMSPFWGSLTHRFSPKLLYVRAIIANVVSCLLMGFTTEVHQLLILRIFMGLVAGTSTIGLIIVSSSSPREKIPSNIGLFQSSMTLGQLLGPLLGSLAAAALGYRWAFISASSIVFLSFLFCCLYVTDVPRLPKKEPSMQSAPVDKPIAIGMMLCFTATVQITFLPSILPTVLAGFHYGQTSALRLAGTVVMFYTATAMIGTYLWSRSARRIGIYRTIMLLFLVATILQAALSFSRSIIDFTAIRMLQTGFVAATFSLVMSIFAGRSRGGVIGILNSSRFAGNALGPLLGTSILAFTSLPFVYFFISIITLFALLCFWALFPRTAVRADA
jgi:DHA1 family multidrug resistance protein-like MFS transporter